MTTKAQRRQKKQAARLCRREYLALQRKLGALPHPAAWIWPRWKRRAFWRALDLAPSSPLDTP